MDSAFALSPADTADVLLEDEALAMAVVFGEMEGGEFSWDSMSWIERNG